LTEIGIPELTSDQMKELCEVAEEAARKYVLSKVAPSKISTLNITVDTHGTKPINVNVDVEITLSSAMIDHDAEKLAGEATKKAFESIEVYLRELGCTSRR